MIKNIQTKNITILDRLLLLFTGLLAAYQVGFGINHVSALPQIFFTAAFGVVLVSGLLIIILGFEILESPLVLVIATIIPISLSSGLVAWLKEDWLLPYLVFAVSIFAIIIFTRFTGGKTIKVISIIFGHSVSGLMILLLPLMTSISGQTPGLFSFVGVGGALIGVGGLLLTFLKLGKPILSRKTILTVLPALLLMMMICFVIGFRGNMQ